MPRALERLMVLDAILEHPDIVWLSTPEEKVAHLTTLTRTPLEDLPHLVIGQGEARQVRYFPDRLPIGIHPEGRVVVVYLLVDPLFVGQIGRRFLPPVQRPSERVGNGDGA